MKLSVLIPSRNELFVQQTIEDILKKATGEIEVIVFLDGYWPDPPLKENKRVHIIHSSIVRGMRGGVNACAAIAKGKYFMKCDAHCMFAEGFDEVLEADMQDNFIVIPRRRSLNAELWAINEKEPIDSEFIFYPYEHPDDLGLHARPWFERGRIMRDKNITFYEDMSFQGSLWFMHRDHFLDRLGGLQEEGYGIFMGEPQEVGFKTQLGPWNGAIMRNTNTWYAHLHKGKQYGRMYAMSNSSRKPGNAYSFDFWWHNRWTERAHNLSWLIEKFWDQKIPTWPQDWRERHVDVY